MAQSRRRTGWGSKLSWPSKQVWFIVLMGQALSLLITGTGVTSQLLASNYHVAIPTTQSFFNYALLTGYLGHVLYRGELLTVFKERWWVYLILGLIDVEANFLVVKAYQYTNITSIMLIDCFAIPTTMLLSYFFLKARYKKLHFLGVLLCLGGLVGLVISDWMTGNSGDEEGQNVLIGDLLCLAGAVLYGVSNVSQEYLVKQRSSSEFLGMLGFWATIISGIQMGILEHEQLATIEWNAQIVLLILGFAACLFTMYSVVPIFLRKAGATAMNLSLLTSDFYGLIFGLFLFGFQMTWTYAFAFVIIIMGLAIYESQPAIETQTEGSPAVGMEPETSQDALTTEQHNGYSNLPENDDDDEEQPLRTSKTSDSAV